MRKLEVYQKKWTPSIIILGGLCFVVLGAVTWYFGYIRPRVNADLTSSSSVYAIIGFRL